MLITKGTYKFIRAGICNSSILNKKESIPLKSFDFKDVVGEVIIEDEMPLTLSVKLKTDIEINSNYFTIIPINYTSQNGYITKITSFKLALSADEYVPYLLDETQFVKKARKKKD